MYLDFLHHFVIRRTRYLGVSITKETARSVLLAAASCIHAGFAMTKAVTIRWIGNFVACMHIHYRVLASRSVDSCFNFCLLMCRKATAEMMCMRCLKIQPLGPVCSTPSGGELSMAKYYCSTCKFFDDERYITAYFCFRSCNIGDIPYWILIDVCRSPYWISCRC